MLSKGIPNEQPEKTQEPTLKSESEALLGMLNVRASSLGAPDGHSDRVAAYALAIGRRLDLPRKMMMNLKNAAILHDVGKVGISPQIVEKLGRLSEREFEIMRLHSTIAIRMLERVPELHDAIPMIKHHHERFDGKGYPDGLSGHDIPLGARIIAVAETFDILVSDVPWRDALPLQVAIEELKNCAGTQFDPMVVEAFLEALANGEVPLSDELKEQMVQPAPDRLLDS
ncbi:MAG: HD domain-containing phosphohydrolase [Armatimonadota bacterium]|nr:HD domain-containing phosphohydrolase [Armatimonadota bacterium]